MPSSLHDSLFEMRYDLFEHFSNGDVLWRMAVNGHENAIQQLKKLAATTSNEVRVVYCRHSPSSV
jgi:hypothetical protein